MITFPRILPSIPGIQKARFAISFNNVAHVSAINSIVQVQERPGDLWNGLYQFAPATAAKARTLKAWIVSMHGESGSFLGFDPAHRTPAGIASDSLDTPIVNGASQAGKSITTSGWRISQNGLLEPGDYIQIGNGSVDGFDRQLKLVTEVVNSDATGLATINFEPILHASPANSAPIIFTNPVGVFRMIDPGAAQWDLDSLVFHGFAFSFVEVPQV